jgi:hypothetical protein
MRLSFLVVVLVAAGCTPRRAATERPPTPTPVGAVERDAVVRDARKPAKADTAAIRRAAPPDSGLWYYNLRRIYGDTAMLELVRRTQPGDTTFENINGQRIMMIGQVSQGYRFVVRWKGVWTLVPLPEPDDWMPAPKRP